MRLRPRWFVCPRSAPLLAGALLVGLASSIYWTFAVEHLQSEGGLPTASSRIVLAIVGLASVGGTVGADASPPPRRARRLHPRRRRPRPLARPARPRSGHAGAPLVASAVLFGAGYNTIVAVAVIWSAEVFAARPSAGLAAVMVMGALGLLAGPPVFGALADQIGLAGVFAAGAVLLS